MRIPANACTLSLTLFALANCSAMATGADVHLSGCVVSLKDQAFVPAPHAGVLMNVSVREGDRLQVGQAIAHIDDSQQRLEQEMARGMRDAAAEKASDDTSVRHAEAARLVAEAELHSAVAVNKRVAGTHSANDIRRLTLAARKAALLVEKTEAERRIAAIDLRGREVSVALAKQELLRCAVESPLAGEVIEVLKHAGEWVNPGEPIAHVVRLDTLCVEGFVNAAEHRPASVRDRPVRVSVAVGQGETAEFTGRVVFVRPTLQAGEQYLIYGEVENRTADGGWLLRPGMLAEMRIETSPSEASPVPARSAHVHR